MNYKQAPAFCVQVEMTEGCNLYCKFCGLRGIRMKKDKRFRFMNADTANNIAKKLASAKWRSRVEFAMHGEPTLNPNKNRIIEKFREHLPDNQLMMTSNGGGLLKNPADSIYSLFRSGLDVLAIDEYEDVMIKDKIRTALNIPVDRLSASYFDKTQIGMVFGKPVLVAQYPETPEFSPHQRFKRDHHRLVLVQDISSANKGSHATLNNHCGAAAPLNDSAQGKRCAKPFRELSVRWDGNIALCCNDWRGVYFLGSLNYDSLDDIWNGKAITSARRYLYHGKREFTPCRGCDALSYRTSLLPDHLGKETLPAPNNYDKIVVRKAQAHMTLTTPILREWER